MMRVISLLSFVFVASFVATPSYAHNSGTATFWGTAVGGTMGGIIGSTIGKGAGRTASTAAGVLVGGLTGNAIGQSIDSTYAYSSFSSSATSQLSSPYAPVFTPYVPRYVAPPSPTIIVVRPQIIGDGNMTENVYRTEGYLSTEPQRPASPAKRYCREFTQTIKIDGQTQESYGTACLRPDGTWEIQK